MPDGERSPYAALRAGILNLDQVPGERLSERGLEGLLGASRTPIRAALMRLEAEGLVRREGRGWQVTPIDLTEVRAVAEFREAVEGAVALLAATRATDDELAALAELARAGDAAAVATTGNAGLIATAADAGARAHLDPDAEPTSGVEAARTIGVEGDGDEEAGVRAGDAFHLALAGLSGNPFLVQSMRDVLTRLSRTRWLDVRTPESRASARREHLAIVEALAARDGERARDLVVAHGRGTRDRILTHLTDERRRMRGRGIAIVESTPA
ncbi:GntR family transcriptional regulator [Herbiconiux sp. CPCC 205716]|uniref:GntR family transcriptional regulator n=1 Tax=Herbiconiux gentiana TaxID=2970912 RepID=A0ABT2GDM5_9MICO|nr:GntR family transcriptional regulator [Herbiconiux gentiana]MCS5714297.1 GntR family transcriptional regulator [Herbiconiux gentiana]